MNKAFIVLIGLMFLSLLGHGQDTIRLHNKPKAIIKSWYPEFKEFPQLKVGESKILFIKIPALDTTSIGSNDIHLVSSNDSVLIRETEKKNQYSITVKETSENSVAFELWLELENKIVLIKQSSDWKDIRRLYPTKGNSIMIDKLKLEIIK